MNKPLVSICCITYNHESFIRDCLEGFMMQQTNFPFEILIHDDASTDGTADIIREYETKYPDIIKPIYQTENQYSKGVVGINAAYNFPRAQGKYVALCEGDDRWISANKLQKQVDYLESHPDCSACYHSVRMINEDGSDFGRVLQCQTRIYPEFDGVPTQTSSFVYKNLPIIGVGMRECGKDLVGGDVFVQALLFQYGYVYAFEDIMSEYRYHHGGVTKNVSWQTRSWTKQWLCTMKYAPVLIPYYKRILVFSIWKKILFPSHYRMKIDFPLIVKNISIFDFFRYSICFFMHKFFNLMRLIKNKIVCF